MKKLVSISVMIVVVVMGLMLGGCSEDEEEFVPRWSFGIILTAEASQREEPFTVDDFPEWNFFHVEDRGNIIHGIQREIIFYLWEHDVQTLYYVIDLIRQRPYVEDWGYPPG